MPRPTVINARAHAKVNLALGVGPALPPGSPFAGHHPIASWMHAIDLGDEVTVAQAEATRYDLAWGDGCPLGWDAADDLTVKAHQAVEGLAGRALPVRLRLRKHIPAGGGLGGGSSDAAAVMLALRDLFALEVPDERLAACAHGLGTDIPFFLDAPAWRARRPPRPALVTGLGEDINRLERHSGPITLVCPPFGCPTGAVYKAFDDQPTDGCDAERVRDLARATLLDPGGLFNDLTQAAERVEPRLATLRRTVEAAAGGPVLLSGSGSTMFCFADAATVARVIGEASVVATRLV